MIDPKKLPASMLIDTTVALRGFGACGDDPRSPVCVALVDACIKHGTSLLIAAPTIAEIRRGGATRPVPRVSHVEVVAFDEKAANDLAKLPIEFLKEFSAKEGLPLTYVKYDALIIACAVRYEAGCFVCLDEKQHRLAKNAGVRALMPESFLSDQLGLF